MEAKTIEIRDYGTFISAIAVRLCSDDTRDQWLLRRAGWSRESAAGVANVGVLLYACDKAHYDPYDWGGRTLPPVHKHLIEHWDEIETGALLDTRVLLGEQPEPCESEQVDE